MAAASGSAGFRALFRAEPGLYLVLDPDLTIVDASDAYLRAALVSREEIVGHHLFEALPDNPEVGIDGVRQLSASILRVLETGSADCMPIQRRDVRDRVSGDLSWVEKYWVSLNSPVFAPGSREVTHILHRVRDVTEAVQFERWLEEELTLNAEQIATLGRMQDELAEHDQQLRAARRVAHEALAADGPAEPSFDLLKRTLGAPESRHYLGPGLRAPITGLYRAFHEKTCPYPSSSIAMRSGSPFHSCAHCRDRILYRLEKRIHL